MLQVSNKKLFPKNLFLLPFLVICFSCQISTPRIADFKIQPNWLYDTESQKISSFLSVYVALEDIDPKRELPRLSLHIIGHDLFWDIPISKENLQRRECSYAAGFLYTLENLPSVDYELRMFTERGLTASEKKTISQTTPPSVSDFPLLHDNRRTASEAVLFVYHQKNFFSALRLDPTYTLPKKERGENFYLYSFSENLQAGLVCGPY